MLEEEIVKKLLEKQYTVTTAESCTGGLLAGRILNVPGASSVYNEGHITYSNEAKERLRRSTCHLLGRLPADRSVPYECLMRNPQQALFCLIGRIYPVFV